MGDKEYTMGDVVKAIDAIAEELKRLADFFVATQKVVPEKESTKKKKKVVLSEFKDGEYEIGRVTAKAVMLRKDNMIAWVPKSCIKNLNDIVTEEGVMQPISVIPEFKVEWKEDRY